jgi:hypothetical protein
MIIIIIIVTCVGQFNCIIGSNLLCRLPQPRKFLFDIPNYLTTGGILILISPYSWLEEYTEKSQWIGAQTTSTDETVESFDILQRELTNHATMPLQLVHRENIPFLIREHERKYQLGISDITVWQRR